MEELAARSRLTRNDATGTKGAEVSWNGEETDENQ